MHLLDGYSNEVNDMNKILCRIGMSENEAKITILLSKNNGLTSPQITNILKISRSDVYRLLKVLQTKQIVFATISNPMKYEIISPPEMFNVFSDQIKVKLIEHKIMSVEFLNIWSKIPQMKEKVINNTDKFQIIKGKNRTNNKIQEMIKKSKNEILILAKQEDFIRFKHANILENTNKFKEKVKIITNDLDQSFHILKNWNYPLKMIPHEKIKNQCFVIIDRKEVLFFIENDNRKIPISIWVNSESVVKSMSVLFDFFWGNEENNQDTYSKNNLEVNMDFKIKELQQELLIFKEIRSGL